VAQTKKKRRRKHAGTQAGTVERSRSSASKRPQSKAESREAARKRRMERLDQPPTWTGAIKRAAIAAVIFAAVVIFAFGRPPLAGLALAGVMFVIYIPMSYFTDRFIHNRRRRQRETSARKPRGEGSEG